MYACWVRRLFAEDFPSLFLQLQDFIPLSYKSKAIDIARQKESNEKASCENAAVGSVDQIFTKSNTCASSADLQSNNHPQQKAENNIKTNGGSSKMTEKHDVLPSLVTSEKSTTSNIHGHKAPVFVHARICQ